MSWRVRSQIKEFQRQHQPQQDPPASNQSDNNTTIKPKAGDYIDFEEIKE